MGAQRSAGVEAEEPPLLVTVAGRQAGGVPTPFLIPVSTAVRSAPDDPAPAPPVEAPPETPLKPPEGPVPEAPAPPVDPPPPAAEEAWLDTESLVAAAFGPQFEGEPDPRTTGDAAAVAVLGVLQGAPGVECPLAGTLRDALQRDAAVQASLARIPQRSRSVANAVMLWDGQWIDASRVGGAATIALVQGVIALNLLNASEACRTQVISGPVFLPVESRSGALVLALGSGEWRWADLLAETPPSGSEVPSPAWRSDRLR